jgi:ApaG protein
VPLSGFEIDVKTRFIERESDPSQRRYVFAYTITIINVGDVAGQLINRHWIITDGKNKVQEVHGRGVVGEQPRIQAGHSFLYTSAAVLETPVGSMHGSYEFKRDDDTLFGVPIPAFSLAVPNLVH